MGEFTSFKGFEQQDDSFASRVNAVVTLPETDVTDVTGVESKLDLLAAKHDIQIEKLIEILREAIQLRIHAELTTNEEVNPRDVDLEMEPH